MKDNNTAATWQTNGAGTSSSPWRDYHSHKAKESDKGRGRERIVLHKYKSLHIKCINASRMSSTLTKYEFPIDAVSYQTEKNGGEKKPRDWMQEGVFSSK